MDFMGKNFFIENSHFYEVWPNASCSFSERPTQIPPMRIAIESGGNKNFIATIKKAFRKKYIAVN